MNHQSTHRREFLGRLGDGFGLAALAGMMAGEGRADQAVSPAKTQHPATATSVIQIFCPGGMSHVDTWDYRPELERLHGTAFDAELGKQTFAGIAGEYARSFWKFRQHGESGRWLSDLFPHMALHVDDMAFIYSMQNKSALHGPAMFMQNSGFIRPGFPCMGSWVTYGLGCETDNLPSFVVLPDTRGLPPGGVINWGAGFLPAMHQGTVMETSTERPAIADLFPPGTDAGKEPGDETPERAFLQTLNRMHSEERPNDSRLDARIASYELAARMQLSAPEAFDLSREPQAVKDAYGIGVQPTDDFGKRCLLAARLAERGVRFTQVWSGPQGAVNNWDNHGSISRELSPMAASVDKPIAALLRDLKARGLDKDTLVIWTTEFGRTPTAQGGDGRDHNGGTFVTWIWGAGVKPGVAYGQSDDLAFKTAVDTTYSYDFHATVLHLLGIDHTKLTWRQNGIDRRLTDVHGHVVKAVLA